MPEFGEILRDHRRAAELTQEELAERALVSTRTVSDLERGVNKHARKHTAGLLADALGLTGVDRDAFVAAAIGRRIGPPRGTPERATLTPVPVPPTPLVGRDADVEQILERLASGSRIVSLVGPGGVGKTHLALAAAGRVGPPTEVAFVALAALSAPDDVLSAIAAATGLAPSGSGPLADELVGHLADRTLLLVVDNMEHVADAGPEVASLVDRLPDLSLLVTSRVRLRLRAEHVQPVRPLEPDEAVELLVARARAIGVEPDPGAAPFLDGIARRLDRLPLAIELAAARLRLLPPAALLARLEDQRIELASDAHDVPERHQTLRATLAWSLDLLGQIDRTVFEDLSVFAGTFSLDAASAVASVGETELFDGIERLVDASLLRTDAGPDGEPRVAMLATMRDGGLTRLAEAGREQAIRDRHLDWFVRVAEAAGDRLVGAEQASWLAQLDADADELRHAINHAVTAGEAGPAVRLGAGLWRWWYLRGLLLDGRHRLAEVLDLDDGTMDGPAGRAAAVAAYGAGNLAYLQGDVDAAVALQERALAAHRALGPHPGEAHVLGTLGMIAQYRGDDAGARARFEEALELGRLLEDARCVAVALTNLASLAKQQGRFDEALGHLAEASGQFERLGDLRSVADLITTRADVAGAQGRYAEAERAARDALARFEELGDRVGQSEARQILADVLDRSGHPGAADEHARVLDLSRELGDDWGEARALSGLAAAADRDGDDPRPQFEASIAAHRRLDHPRGLGLALIGLARCTPPVDAVGHLKEARAVLAAAGDPDAVTCLEELATLALAHAQPDRAARLLGAAAARRETIGFPIEQAAVAVHEARHDALRQLLGADEARRLEAEGHALTDAEVAALANAVHV